MMAINDANFVYRHFEVPRNKLEDTGVRHVAFRFFAHRNQEMVG